MDTQLRQIFLKLLQAGLWGNKSFDLEIPLSVGEWERIYFHAVNHTVEGIIYDSINLLSESQLPPQSLRLKWAVRIDKIERNNILMNKTIEFQYKEFCKHGLSPILQKGQGVAKTYRIPLHRVCGDIDWYFSDNGYSKARDYIKNKQLIVKDTRGYSLFYNYRDQFIEHHSQLFDIKNPFKFGFLKKIEKHYRNQNDILQIGDINIQILAPELQIFQVSAHILKHLIAFGMGLRQFCDVANLYIYYAGRIKNEELKSIYKNVGILGWVHVLHQFLVDHLGLPKKYIPFPYPENTKSEWMLEEIWHGGNFGYYDDRYTHGKIIKAVSVHPEGAKRLWNNCKRYFPYAPQEVLFFPIMHFYGKLIGIDRD